MAALDPQRFGGQTYEIGGPQVMSMVELHRAILEITGQTPDIDAASRISPATCSSRSAGCPARR